MNNKLIRLSESSAEDLRKWQLKLFEILCYFDDFCKENNLKYYIAAGTLIGAVRHKGFIPWDDDLDVCMMRDDYEKLYELWPQKADTKKYSCCRTTRDYPSQFPMITIRDNNTTAIYPHSSHLDICHGLKIDVEFYDGVPTNKFSYRIYHINRRIRSLFAAQRVPNRSSRIMKIGSWVLLSIFRSSQIREKIRNYSDNQLRKYKVESSEYIQYAGSVPPYKRCWYDDCVMLEFEGRMFPAPIGYKEYLETHYGDYMQLPPVECRKPTTELVFYDLNNGYEKYKGIHYLVK